MDALPTGIRKRGEAFQYIISKNGRQYTGTFDNLDDAIRARKDRIENMVSEDPVAVQKKIARSMSFSDAVNKAYNLRWQGTKAERTTMVNANTLIKYFGKKTPIKDITTEEVNTFICDQRDQGLSNGTINRKLACLSVILKTAEDCGIPTANPTLMRRREYKGRERFLSEEEEHKAIALLAVWGKMDHQDAFIVLLDTGMRSGELFKLQAKDADFKQGKYGILTLWRTKNDHPRSVPMTSRVSSIIKRRVSVINKEDKIFNHNLWWLRNVWDRMKSHMGLTKDSQFVPHILRHTCASRLVQKGIPLMMVQKWLGHESLQSTMRYSHLCPDALFDLVP